MKSWYYVFPLVALSSSCGTQPSQDAPLAAITPESRITQALANGTFNLTASSNGRMCLDVAGGDNRNGALVQLAECNGGAAQAWVHQGAQWRIFGDKCLNVVDGKDQNGTRLQIWGCSDNDANAAWTVKADHLQWKNRNRCLDISGGQVRPGTPMQLWDCDMNNSNQSWNFSGSTGSAPVANAPRDNTNVGQNNAFGASPKGLDVAPYFWTWARWGSYAVGDLNDAYNKAGMASATIAFGLSSGNGCNLGSDLTDMGDSIRSYIGNGRRVILSFGGAAGTYLEDTCNDAAGLARALDGQMRSLNTRALDFDIEGSHLNTMDRTNVLLDGLKILQGQYSDLYVSFTLPVDDNSGLPDSALNVVRGAKNKGVKVSRVNIMTMDFGHGPRAGQNFGDQCINAATATFGQLKNLYNGASDGDIWHLIGITPMIGENDDHYKMTVADAQKVAAFAKNKGVGMLSFWGMQRDRSGWGSLDNFTNVNQNDFDFTRAFNAAR